MIDINLIKKRGGLIVPLLLFMAVNVFSQEMIELKVVDCVTQSELNECLIFSTKGDLLGITNYEGECSFNSIDISEKQKVVIQKFDYKTIEIELKNGQNSICLERLLINLAQIEISSNFDINKYFLELIKKTKSNGLTYSDTLFYEFDYTLALPDSNWTETLSGVLAVPRKPINKNYWQQAYYTQYLYYIDSIFFTSDIYAECPPSIIKRSINNEGAVLYKRRKIEKFIRKNNFSINTDLNTTSQIAIQFNSEIKDVYHSIFIFNREDSCLSRNISYFAPIEKFRVGKNSLRSSFTDVHFSSANPVVIDLFQTQNEYQNKNSKILIEFSMKRITNTDEIQINKLLPFQKVLMVSLSDNIRTIEAK
jgi:hypothetical protein